MPNLAVAPLVVSNEAFLVKSLIERCPKTMMLRELVVNAIEAAYAARPGPAVVRIGAESMEGVPKLRIWNTGPGLSATELDRMCDIASSIGKVVGLDGNFGMGAKVASLPSNGRGVVYRSCSGGRVHQVIMGCHDGVYGRLLQAGPDGAPARVVEVTETYQAGAALEADWTEVVLVGNRDGQDTLAQPFDGAPEMAPGWIAESLTRRFFHLPPSLELELLPGVAGPERWRFVPMAKRMVEFTRFETVPSGDGGLVHFGFLEGPAGIPVPGAPTHELRGLAGIVHRGEIYGLRLGNQWVLDAPAFGISFGARSITVMIELAEDAPVRPEAYRQFLRTLDGDQHQMTIGDYAAAVRQLLPGWLRDIIAASTPRQADYLAEVQDELKALAAELELPPDEAPAPQPAADPGETPTSPWPRSPPPRRFLSPPELIALHDQGQVDDRGLNGRAAQFLPAARQLYVNMLYPGVLRTALELQSSFAAAPDQDRVAALATEVAEWSMLRLVARAAMFSLAKGREGWSKEELARAQSPEALTLVADNGGIGIPAALRRLARLLSEGEPPVAGEEQAAGGQAVDALRSVRRREVELVTAEQAARRGLASGFSPPAPFMRRLSEVAMRRRDLTLALDWARKAVEVDGKDPWSQHQLSGLLLAAGDLDGAEQAGAAALDAEPRSHPALLRRMAELKVHRKDKAAAIIWSRKAVEADEMDCLSHFGLAGALLASDLLDEAEREARMAIDHAPQPAPGAFYARVSDIFLRRGDRDTALQWIRQAVEVSPEDMWSQFSLAGLLMGAGRFEEAAAAARRAVLLGGAQPPPAMARRLSEAELALRNVPEAAEWARRAVDSDPGDSASQHQLSAVLQRAGDLPGASAAAMAAIEAAGEPVPPHLLRRLSEVRREEGELEEALLLARRAAAGGPDPWSSLHLARLLLSTRALDEALAAAKQAISAAQGISNGVFARTLSEIHAARKEPERALAWARKAVMVDETDEWSHSHLAALLLSAGNLDGAERSARLALIHSAPGAVDHFVGLVQRIETSRNAASAA